VTAATSAIPLSNVEAQWATLSPAEQTAVHQQLEEIQRKDWKTLSLAEKKAGASVRPLFDIVPSVPRRRVRGGRSVLSCCSYALHRPAYYVAFGPHGPRAPVNPPGTVVKIFTGISVLVGTASLIYAGIRSIGVLARSIFHHIVLTSTVFLFFCFNSKKRTAPPPPKSISKEWEEATNERAKELKINPITGPYLLHISFCYFFDPLLSSCLRGGNGVQVFHRRATLARALLHTSRFSSVAVGRGACCGGRLRRALSDVFFLVYPVHHRAAVSVLALKINHFCFTH